MCAVCIQGVKAYMCCFRVSAKKQLLYFMHNSADGVLSCSKSVHKHCILCNSFGICR